MNAQIGSTPQAWNVQDKEVAKCRADTPKGTANVTPKKAAKSQAEGTKLTNEVQLIQVVRAVMPLGQNPTMTTATLTKLRKRCMARHAVPQIATRG